MNEELLLEEVGGKEREDEEKFNRSINHVNTHPICVHKLLSPS